MQVMRQLSPFDLELCSNDQDMFLSENFNMEIDIVWKQIPVSRTPKQPMRMDDTKSGLYNVRLVPIRKQRV